VPYKDPEKYRESQRKYRAEHREELREYDRKYHAANSEKFRYDSKYYAAHPEEQQEKNRRYNAAHPEKALERSRNYKYGKGSQDHLQAQIKAQLNCCAICDKPFTKTPGLDHNHLTGQWRGALCRNCNLLISFADEVYGTLLKAGWYLKKWRNYGKTMHTNRSA
jgi:hypothetical protein